MIRSYFVFGYYSAEQTVAEGWVLVLTVIGAFSRVGVLSSVGLILGIYSAKHTSKKSPIETLQFK